MAILGNRSVVYAPAARLGLIAIWNDGDPLLAEPLSPNVHPRDAALVRQEQQDCALLIAGHTRTTEVQRLVEVGWLEELRPAAHHPAARHPDRGDRRAGPPRRAGADPVGRLAGGDQGRSRPGRCSCRWRGPATRPDSRCADCGEPARCRRCAGPLQFGHGGAPASCGWCGAVETAWVCSELPRARSCGPSGAGADRTADELGRAFPGVRVIVADGEHPLLEIDDRPALVIATRGAEPIAAGGYRAVLLLDGERMVARESLRVGEDCLRWWSDAASLAADDAPVVLVGRRRRAGDRAQRLAPGRVRPPGARRPACAAVPSGGAGGDPEWRAGCGGRRDRGPSGRRRGARDDPARGPCPRDRALRLRARRRGRQGRCAPRSCDRRRPRRKPVPGAPAARDGCRSRSGPDSTIRSRSRSDTRGAC